MWMGKIAGINDTVGNPHLIDHLSLQSSDRSFRSLDDEEEEQETLLQQGSLPD